MREGYDSEFLGHGFEIPLPKPSLEIQDDVLHIDSLDTSPIINYIHYSLMISKSNKQAFFSAANVDRSKKKTVSGRNWFVDPRVGKEYQITNDFYKNNVWDKGHLTRRTAVTWGSNAVARNASNDSCAYTNASLQHKFFNQDEWRVVELLVDKIETVKDKKMCVFTGPLFTQTDRWYTRRATDEKIRIPSGFWKLLAYINTNTDKLLAQAFVLFQDKDSMKGRDGMDFLKEDIHEYQVTTTELELLTGLEFPKILFDTNPLYFFPHEGINELPEGIGIPQNLTEKEFKEYFVFNEGGTLDETVRDQQRNLSKENFERIIYAMDH